MTLPGHSIFRLEARQLRLERGGKLLAQNLSFELGPGAALIVTGPNGAGKTTLLRVLAGLARPSGGAVALTPGPPAFLGHGDALKASETVGRALAFWTAMQGGDEEAIEPVMRTLALTHLARRPAGTLSAGQKRRTALARIALSGRAVWLLDEPAAPLDARSRERLASLAAAHRRAGGIIAAATHADLEWPDCQTLELAP
jgi:heme exporter protein A